MQLFRSILFNLYMIIYKKRKKPDTIEQRDKKVQIEIEIVKKWP